MAALLFMAPSCLLWNSLLCVSVCIWLTGYTIYTSIKVYLSMVRSLHIDQGFSDPLVNCLLHQCLPQGIKHHQSSHLPLQQLVTLDLTLVLLKSLDLQLTDHAMPWAASCLGFFGFLRAGEFTENSPFDPTCHLTLQDLQLDIAVNPSSLRVHIKRSKTDPFRQGSFIFLGHEKAPI